jgi:chromosome segregation ATPase
MICFSDIKSDLKQKLGSAISELHNLESKSIEYRTVLGHKEKELKAREEKIDTLVGKVKALEAENILRVNQMTNVKKVRDELGEQVSELSEELLDSQFKACQLKRSNDDLQDGLTTAKALQQEMEKDRSSFEEEIVSLEKVRRDTLANNKSPKSTDSMLQEFKDPQTEQNT